MLNIINNLRVFFEDNYREISVREYGRITKMSPPSASKLLKEFEKQGLLKMREERKYILFRVNRENKIMLELSHIYWSERLKDLVDYSSKELNYPTILLFGSLSKLESKTDSDIDLVVIGTKKKADFQFFEKKLGRKIQLFYFSSFKEIKSKELLNNILNGQVLRGRISL